MPLAPCSKLGPCHNEALCRPGAASFLGSRCTYSLRVHAHQARLGDNPALLKLPVAKRENADDRMPHRIFASLPSSPDCPETAECLRDDCSGGSFANPRPCSPMAPHLQSVIQPGGLNSLLDMQGLKEKRNARVSRPSGAAKMRTAVLSYPPLKLRGCWLTKLVSSLTRSRRLWRPTCE
jgi:hypothetical protein